MAANLLKAGHTLQVFDVDPKAAARLENLGAQICPSPTDIDADVNTVFTMLPNGSIVRQLLSGETGLFSRVPPQTLFIDCSSIDVTTARQLSEEATQRHLEMIDAPFRAE